MADEQTVFGLHAVEALLRRNPQAVSQLRVDRGRRDARMDAVLELAAAHGIPVVEVSKKELETLSGREGRHQGVIAECRPPAVQDESFLDRLLESGRPDLLLLVLDGVQDPHNLGACLRTADGAGVHAVVAPRDRAATLNATVRKVACGAAETVPFVQVTNLARTLRLMQDAGVWLIGTAGEAEASLYEVDLRGRIGIVMGAEGEGMRRLTRDHCDYLVRLPMQGSVESLNVSVATGICLFEAVRQRLFMAGK